jgi:dipeptidyl aminopeptidase/acylaminoacyl peptidase
MKTSVFFMSILISVSITSCTNETEDTTPIVKRPEIKVSNGLLTPEILYSLARISDARLSPDGQKVLYGVSFSSIEENKGNRELFTVNVDGTGKKQLTATARSEQNAAWLQNGREIAFLSGESGSSQLWIMNIDGTNRRRISNYGSGINSFIFSPDEKNILFISDINCGKRTSDIYPDLPKASGRIVDDLMYKHWDEWVETIPHPFVAPFDGNKMGEAIDVMEGEPYECPIKPMNGIEDLAWSPNGKMIAYASRKKTGLAYAVSTNSDIYLYNVETKQTSNLTEGMMGYDTHPAFSPDGKYIAWISQERDGYESDKRRLFIADMQSGEKEDITSAFDYNVDDMQWNRDSRSFYAIVSKEGLMHIWQIGLDKTMRQITTGQYDYVALSIASGNMIAIRQSQEYAPEIFAVNTESGEAKEISFENKAVFDQLTTAKSEPRWIKTTDGKQMLVWVVYPPNFDPDKKYPALLYCQGGPQSMVSQFWSYRWNLQLMAANGYIIVAPNRRGLPGFGQEWLEQISGDYGGQNMKDYFTAIDEVAKEPYVDENRLGAVGASYGGFSIYWLAGRHGKRFKAFIAHAGIFNLEAQYLETEEMWFANWDMGGPYWDKNNPVAQRTFANSPHRFVDKWDTPILVTHGELDYRILASQGMSAFNAAKLRGIPAEMLIFPDENHWITQPQNGILFQRVFFNWLDKWLKY